jgi:hypothetical protein
MDTGWPRAIGPWHGMRGTASSVRLLAEWRLHLRLKAMPKFCACSTRIVTTSWTLREFGSSLRVQGTYALADGNGDRLRFIPACAGNMAWVV